MEETAQWLTPIPPALQQQQSKAAQSFEAPQPLRTLKAGYAD